MSRRLPKTVPARRRNKFFLSIKAFLSRGYLNLFLWKTNLTKIFFNNPSYLLLPCISMPCHAMIFVSFCVWVLIVVVMRYDNSLAIPYQQLLLFFNNNNTSFFYFIPTCQRWVWEIFIPRNQRHFHCRRLCRKGILGGFQSSIPMGNRLFSGGW